MTIRAFLLFIMMAPLCFLYPNSDSFDVEPDFHKTVILFKILQFVDFPAASDGRIDLTCFGDGPMIKAIDNLAPNYLISGKRIHTRHVHSLKEFKEIDRTDLLFISRNENELLPAILAEVRKRKILCVSDGDDFAKKGVHVNLFTYKERISFEINRTEVEKIGLHLSSRLYKLARIVQ